MIPAQNLRTCVVCAYLMEQEVLDPMNEVVNGCKIKCCWETNPDTTGEACEKCLHFANLHKELSKGGDNHVKKAVETHQKATAIDSNGLGKGKGRGSDEKRKGTAKQLELDPDISIKT